MPGRLVAIADEAVSSSGTVMGVEIDAIIDIFKSTRSTRTDLSASSSLCAF